MKSKAGNKLKKIRKLALAAGLALAGCITEPKSPPDLYVTADCPALPDEQGDSAGVDILHYHNCVLDTVLPQANQNPYREEH